MFIEYLTLITSLVVSLFHFSLTVSGIGVLWLIPNTMVKLIGHWEGAFDLGLFNMKCRSNRLLKTPIWGSGKVLWVLRRIPCRIFSPLLNVRSGWHPYEVPCVNTERLKTCFVMHVLIELALLKIKAFSPWFAQTHSNVFLPSVTLAGIENFDLTPGKNVGAITTWTVSFWKMY